MHARVLVSTFPKLLQQSTLVAHEGTVRVSGAVDMRAAHAAVIHVHCSVYTAVNKPAALQIKIAFERSYLGSFDIDLTNCYNTRFLYDLKQKVKPHDIRTNSEYCRGLILPEFDFPQQAFACN